jgi:hypothetical protein
MNFKFEFLNFQINHLAQLGMINIIFKCKKHTYVKKFIVFTIIQHGFWLLSLYLHPIVLFVSGFEAPPWRCLWLMLWMQH